MLWLRWQDVPRSVPPVTGLLLFFCFASCPARGERDGEDKDVRGGGGDVGGVRLSGHPARERGGEILGSPYRTPPGCRQRGYGQSGEGGRAAREVVWWGRRGASQCSAAHSTARGSSHAVACDFLLQAHRQGLVLRGQLRCLRCSLHSLPRKWIKAPALNPPPACPRLVFGLKE